jgi:hypothetical protein
VIFVDPKSDTLPKLTLDGPEGGAGIPVAICQSCAHRRADSSKGEPQMVVVVHTVHGSHGSRRCQSGRTAFAHLIIAAELAQSSGV